MTNQPDLLSQLEYLDADLIQAAQRRPARRWRLPAALAACLCVVVAAAALLTGRPAQRSVLQWQEGFSGADYFAYNSQAEGGSAINAIADTALPYAESRDFSDLRTSLETQGVLPQMTDYPLFTCTANYNADGTLYSLVLGWNRRGETAADYGSLRLTAGLQPVEEISDCVVVEVDDDGSVVEPAVTVTQRDGIDIVARGRADQDKTLTWQTPDGWYQISGSWNDSCDAMVELLDWFWTHPLDFAQFPQEAGSIYTSADAADYREALASWLPDFAVLGYTLEEESLLLKDGAPSHYEGHYAGPEGALHWCILAEPDFYDLQRSLGDWPLTEAQITQAFSPGAPLCFLKDGRMILFYADSARQAWQAISTLQ